MSNEFKTIATPSNKLPVSAHQAEEYTCNHLSTQLEQMFASCDDLFFDLSGRATSNSEQNLYFESMREIRLRKDGVLTAFKRELSHNFNSLMQQEHSAGAEQAEFDPSKLSLIENDQLEQKVAMSAMITKARANYQEQLYYLNCRFDYLIKHKPVDNSNNPLDPELICRAFAAAIENLELNIKARIILLKQFDRYLVSQLESLYQQINTLMANAGVLPNIKTTISKSSSAATASAAGMQADTDDTASGLPAGSGQGSFSQLQTMIDGLRQGGIIIPSFISLAPGYVPSAPPMPRTELVQSLDQVVQRHAANDHGTVLDIRSAIQNIISSQQQAGVQQSIAQVDEDVINLVAMFFDFILDDNNIPSAIQALLGRLQLPVLKLALKDRSFFNNHSHPARSLINKIANSTLGCEFDPERPTPLLRKISSCVHIILEEYASNPQVFEQQLADFTDFTDKENRKASLVEKRISDAAIGKTKTNFARQQIDEVVQQHLHNKSLPSELLRFLNNDWKRVMLLTLLRDGEQSGKWLEVIQVIDDLVWSCTPHDDEKSLERLQGMIQPLQQRIAAALQESASSESEISTLLDSIEALHQKALGKRHDEIDYISQSNVPEPRLTAIERQKQKQEQVDYGFVKIAEKLPIGAWLEFTDNNVVFRGKLTAKLDEADTFIFVNRFGAKTVEKSRRELALALQRKQARIMEQGPVFERTIDQLSQKLKKLAND